MTDKLSTAARMMRLYVGNKRSFGGFNPRTAKARTIKHEYTLADFEAHIAGTEGMGVSPILDDNTCYFFIIDIDCHDGPEVDLVQLEQRAREHRLPSLILRSKRGGAHATTFVVEPITANFAQSLMTRWSILLGYPGSEIFPKQGRLVADNVGELQFGSWINLPYLGGDESNRYCVEGGKRIGLEHFLDLAYARRVSRASLEAAFIEEHPEAPPCFQRMLAEGVVKFRNEALYNATIYLRRAFPDEWRDRAFDFNATAFGAPLSVEEARKTITSAGRRDYKYKCSQEPICSLCNREVCLTREFGIKPTDIANIGVMPVVTSVQRYVMEPYKWRMLVDGVPVTMSDDEFQSYRLFRRRINSTLLRILPRIKDEQWEEILDGLYKSSEDIVVPDEATTEGLMRARLREWLLKAKVVKEESDREMLLRDAPIFEPEYKRYIFRISSFVSHLKRTRSEDLRGNTLYLALEAGGIKHDRLRVGGQILKVWTISEELVGATAMPQTPQTFESEY